MPSFDAICSVARLGSTQSCHKKPCPHLIPLVTIGSQSRGYSLDLGSTGLLPVIEERSPGVEVRLE